jgi:hypothetical protein
MIIFYQGKKNIVKCYNYLLLNNSEEWVISHKKAYGRKIHVIKRQIFVLNVFLSLNGWSFLVTYLMDLTSPVLIYIVVKITLTLSLNVPL